MASSGMIRSPRSAPAFADIATGALIAILAGLLSLPSFSDAGYPQDEGVLLVAPERILHGAAPHRDFLTLYGPGDFWLLALAFKAFGTSITTERSVGLGYHLAIVVAIFLLTRSSGRATAVFAAGVSAAFLTVMGLAAFAWAGGYAALLWSIVVLSRDQYGRHGAFLSGVLSGAAGLFRPELVAISGVVSIALLWRQPRSRAVAFTIGLFAGLVPLAIHIAVVGPAAFFGAYLGMALYVVPAGRLPVPPPDGRLLALFALELASVALALVVGIADVICQRSSGVTRLRLAVALMAGGLLLHILQRADEFHLIYVGGVTVPLLAPALRAAIERLRLPGRLVTAVSISVALVAIATMAPRVVLSPARNAGRALGPAASSSTFLEHAGRTFPLEGGPTLAPSTDSNGTEDLRATLAAVDSLSAGGRLIVGPQDLTRTYYTDTYLYFLLPQFTPGTYYLDMAVGAANGPGSRLANDIAGADVLILTRRYDPDYDVWTSGLHGDRRALDVVAACFVVREAHGDYQVLTRREDARPDCIRN